MAAVQSWQSAGRRSGLSVGAVCGAAVTAPICYGWDSRLSELGLGLGGGCVLRLSVGPVSAAAVCGAGARQLGAPPLERAECVRL